MHEYGATIAYSVSDEAYGTRKVLTDIFPWNVHHVEDFVLDFLFGGKETDRESVS